MIRRIIMTSSKSLDAVGGGTKSYLQIAHHLQGLGIEIILMPISKSSAPQLQADLFNVVSVKPNRLHYMLDGLAIAEAVKKIAMEDPVDAVLSWGHEAAFLPEFLKSQKIVFGMIAASPSYTAWKNRKTNFRLVKKLIDEWFRWRLFKCADVVFVSSIFTQKELTTLFELQSKQMAIVHRGIDTVFGKVARSHPQTISNFIFYGSLAPNKGVFDTIKALGYVATKGHKNWKLKIAGWGDEEALRQAAREYGIEDQVLFAGCLQANELALELEWAHLAVLPSQMESFGRSIAEAQAAGLAVVSYSVGSIPEIVVDGSTGWLVQPERVDLLGDAIIEAIKNPEKTFQMGLAGRDRVASTFSWELTAKKIIQGIETAKQRI